MEHIKPETLLEAKMTKPKLSHFRHIMRRQGSLEKKNNNVGENRKQQGERKTNMRWIDPIRIALSVTPMS